MEVVDVIGKGEFWRGRRVLLTGHTGFKGAWCALWLERLGAHVVGLALPPEGEDTLFDRLSPWPNLRSIIADVRDAKAVGRILDEVAPEIVIHMAAQAIVRRAYRDPLGTFATNVMGTANVLSAISRCNSMRAVLVVTSDKVYENRNFGEPFTEADPLGGDDPYSASKAAAEAVVRAWRHAAAVGKWGLGAARAGNVIGGGDWGEDRLVPDVVRAGRAGQPVVLRHPQATRPWQHVLDVVAGYAAYAERLATDPTGAPPALNFGPPLDARPVTVSMLVSRLQSEFGWIHGWVTDQAENPPEKTILSVDAHLATTALGWRASLSTDAALAWTAAWHHAHLRDENMRSFSLQQIDRHASMAPLQTVHIG